MELMPRPSLPLIRAHTLHIFRHVVTVHDLWNPACQGERKHQVVKALIRQLDGLERRWCYLQSLCIPWLAQSLYQLCTSPPLRSRIGFCSNVTWLQSEDAGQSTRPKHQPTGAAAALTHPPSPRPRKPDPCDSPRPIAARPASCLLLPFAWVTTRPAVAAGVIHHTPAHADAEGFSATLRRLPSITSRTASPLLPWLK